jgi:hypothetical protein
VQKGGAGTGNNNGSQVSTQFVFLYAKIWELIANCANPSPVLVVCSHPHVESTHPPIQIIIIRCPIFVGGASGKFGVFFLLKILWYRNLG